MRHDECIQLIADAITGPERHPWGSVDYRRRLADASRICLTFLSEGEYHDTDHERADILSRLEAILSDMCGLHRSRDDGWVPTLAGPAYMAPTFLGAPTMGGAVPDSFEEKYEWDVVLTAAGPRPLDVVRVLRQFLERPLKESLDGVRDVRDGGFMVVQTDLPKYEAEQMRKALVAVGATVELR